MRKLFAVISQRSLAFSLNTNSLARPNAITLTPGPLITPLPDVPNWPGCGGAKALVSNQRSILRCPPDKLGFFRMSGRIVTEAGVLESVNAMPTGSSPDQNGVRNMPVCNV